MSATTNGVNAGESPATETPVADVAPQTSGKQPGPSVATKMTKLIAKHVDLWHSPAGDAYASIRDRVDGHCEHHLIGSTGWRRWLSTAGWRALKTALDPKTIKTITTTVEGIARCDGEKHEVHTRVAGVDDKIYVDLADDKWRAIEISRGGWRIVDDPPARFVRGRSTLALPDPVRGGSIVELRDHVRVSDDSWPLVAGWLVGAFSPDGPYPALVFRGIHGAGKTWGARSLRSLIDPSVAPIRAEPREPRDLVICARGSWVCAYDNISSVPTWLSDGLCRLATGGGYAARQLYTDGDEFVIDVKRPTILTGITDVVTAPDLLDRSLLVELDSIPPRDRQTERRLLKAWESGPQKRILGALCDALAVALQRRDEIQLEKLPRLADWAELASAAEPLLGLTEGSVIAALDAQDGDKTSIALEATVIARPIRDLVASHPRGWIGTTSDLLDAINRRAGMLETDKRWPRNPSALRSALARIVPALKDVGIVVEQLPRGSNGFRGERPYRLSQIDEAQPDQDAQARPNKTAKPQQLSLSNVEFDDWANAFVGFWRRLAVHLEHERKTATDDRGQPKHGGAL